MVKSYHRARTSLGVHGSEKSNHSITHQHTMKFHRSANTRNVIVSVWLEFQSHLLVCLTVLS
uniref:Uncharacterized protein n=2 Tax=Anguilla anguilla TaxID=7936 RepID=A0A0E9SIZ6_ANGAN